MQIRFTKKWHAYVNGDYTFLADDLAETIIQDGYAIAITESANKAIEKPEKDKMLRNYKRK